ncbi:capsule biosynthesis protein CapK [Spirochaetia bacterium]|nr:capsule biosynthesis protein CapK [Spirochaetia bacterium]
MFTDWITYQTIYEVVPSLFSNFDYIEDFFSGDRFASLEIGYLIYNVICKTISPNFFFFQFISSLIDLIILYYFFKKYIPDRIVFGFLFFLVFSGVALEINLMRNVKAIMLFLISIKYIETRKLWPYMAINACGIMFHASSIVYLPLYFILNRSYSKILILSLFLAGCVIFLFSIKWIKGLIIPLAEMGNTRLSILVRIYLDSDLYSQSSGLSIGFIERNLTFIIFLIYHDKLVKNSNQNIIFLNCAFIYNFIYLFCSELYALIFRFPFLFVFSYWILYPRIYNILSRKKQIIFLTILLFYSVTKLIVTYDTIGMSYKNVLFKHESYEQARIIAQSEGELWKKDMIQNMHK